VSPAPRTVALVVPRTGPTLLFAPYNYMALIPGLEAAGYRPVIVDARLEAPRPALRRLAENGGLVAVGMTSMMGPQLSYGLELAEYVKARWPHIPVVWGGILPTELPELSLQHPAIDALVLGWGEERFPALLDRLTAGALPSDLDGVGYREHGEPVVRLPDLRRSAHPPLAYAWDAVDLSPFIMTEYGIGARTLTLITSRGCPHRCTFCYGPQFHGSTWTGQSAEQILDDVDRLRRRYVFDGVFFNDDNFAVHRGRLEAVAAGLRDRGIRYGLSLHVSYADEDLVRLLADTGCARLYWGPESGSARMLDIYGKGTTPEQSLQLARWCGQYGLGALMGFMVGHPEETDEDLALTLDHIDELVAIDPRLDISDIKIFTPYPGTAFFAQAVAAGFEPPQRIEDWSTFYWNRSNVPWLTPERRRMLETLSYTSLTAFATWRTRGLNPLQNRVVEALHRIEQARWRRRWFGAAPELRLLQLWVDEHRANRTSRLDGLRRLRESGQDAFVAWLDGRAA
jgi:anaerobic magnesium-protoporphyrin IX monomethyl ester cyclase